MCVGDFSVSLEMAGRGETYQTSGGECFAVRYGLSDFRLRLAAYGPLPARYPPPEWGWAGKKKCSAFFLRFEGCPLAFGEWGLGNGFKIIEK